MAQIKNGVIKIKKKIKSFLYGFCFQLIIIFFVFGIFVVGYEAENCSIAKSPPILVFDINNESVDMAIFGEGISIERNDINKAVLTAEKFGILIPPKYRLCLQLLKFIKTQ